MSQITVKFKKLTEDAICPTYAHEGDAGADIYANHKHVIHPKTTILVSTGISVELPPNVEMQIRSRSGLASKGIVVANSPGTIDSGYRGEVMVLLHNNTSDWYVVEKGSRIAQAVFNILPTVKFEEVNKLSESERNLGGFGSTGV